MIRKKNETIDSLESWERLAGPKSKVQWQDDRSAKESARAWLDDPGGPPGIPGELEGVLATSQDFTGILDWKAEPEALVSFDAFSGPANIDVLLTARDQSGPFVMAVEAKADETFGSLVSRALSDALERLQLSSTSNGLARIEQLVGYLIPPGEKRVPKLHQIRYQLLTGTAAALAHAKAVGATRAVLMIHEFHTVRTDPKKRAANGRDLVRFLKRMGIEEPEGVLEGELLGPISVRGEADLADPVRLYVGKAVRKIVERDPRTAGSP